MISTTLNRIKENHPCTDGWKKLLKHLNKTEPDDEVLPYSVIVESNGLDDALWCCRAEPQHHKEWRLFAVWCCGQIRDLITDNRSINAIKVAEDYAHGKATYAELAVARAAAMAVTSDGKSDATWAATWAATWDATWAATWAARSAATWAAARSAERDAARDAARAAQKEEFLRVVEGGVKQVEKK